MIALISDIHGNLEALKAVLADIDDRRIDRILCLGDVVGYGPDPAACVDLVMSRAEVYLKGNHEHAMMSGTVGYNRMASESIAFSRRQLEPGALSFPGKRRRWRFIQALGVDYAQEGVYYCHASPRDPVNEYILPQDAEGAHDKLRDIFSRFDHLCFVGHTHAPGVMTDAFEFLTPASFGNYYSVQPDAKAVVNIGSVGQPRDGDNRACYVCFDGYHRVEYVRLNYDYRKTIDKILRQPALSQMNAARLEEGI